MTATTMTIKLFAIAAENRVSYQKDGAGVKTCILHCYDSATDSNWVVDKKKKLPNGDSEVVGVEMSGVGCKPKSVRVVFHDHLPVDFIKPDCFPCPVVELKMDRLPEFKKMGVDSWGRDLPPLMIVSAVGIKLGVPYINKK